MIIHEDKNRKIKQGFVSIIVIALCLILWGSFIAHEFGFFGVQEPSPTERRR